MRMLLGMTMCAVLSATWVAPEASAAEISCTPAVARSEARAWIDRIAAAPSVEDARVLATRPTRGAQLALAQARKLAPWTDSLRSAHERLSGYEARVATAPTQKAVAAELATLVGVLPGNVKADVTVGDGGGCSYSTGEVIATVLGFILGIIPGIILLFLLC